MSSASAAPPQAKGFRADINGLRAWAVMAVVLYHFGVPGFQGGFVGVDVFFVISGFLMTGIIVGALQAGGFSLWQFYWARARRILPALVALCAVALAVGWFALMPAEYQTLGRHVRDSLLFTSNLRYLGEAGYFDTGAHDKWLLHTWSLSVEWQFYLLLPLALLGFWRFLPGRPRLAWAMIGCCALFLGWSIALTALQPVEAFFLLQSRAWELLVGGVVFLLGDRIKLSGLLCRRLSWLGLLLIVSATLCYSPQTQWPGWRAVLPVGGTALVLLAQRSDSLWTASRVAQWLGDRSYSIYLWHWPVIVGLSYFELLAHPWWVTAGIAIALLLGHCSYAWVEVPSRRALEMLGAVRGAACLLSLALIVVIGAQLVRKLDLPERLPAVVRQVELAGLNHNPRQDECLQAKAACVYGGNQVRGIVLGDSHADAVVTAVAASLGEGQAGLLFKGESGCLIMLDAKPLKKSKDCERLKRWVAEQLPQTLPGVPVILVNRTAVSVFGGLEGEPGGEPGKPRVYFRQKYAAPTDAFLQEFREGYVETACRIAKHHPLYLLRPIPEMPVNVPNAIGRALLRGEEGRTISLPQADYRQRQAFILSIQDEAVERCGAKVLDPVPFLCSQGQCRGNDGNLPLYTDDDHLNEFGNRRLLPLFVPIFQGN